MPAALIIFALNKLSEMLHDLDPDWLPIHAGRVESPELKLIAAILGDAILLIQHSPKSLGKERIEALAWVESNSAQAFSFNFCCVTLNLHPQCVRKAILGQPCSTNKQTEFIPLPNEGQESMQ